MSASIASSRTGIWRSSSVSICRPQGVPERGVALHGVQDVLEVVDWAGHWCSVGDIVHLVFSVNYFCRRVASLGNVTETLALGVRSNQR